MTNRWTNKALNVSALALVGLLAVGCGGDDDDDNQNTKTVTHLEIAGTWGNADFMETDTIADASWITAFAGDTPFTSTSTVTKFDNAENYAILEGDDGMFSRVVWTDIEGGSFYNCTVDFGLATAEDAEASTKTADASDPDNGGCGDGGFSWTKLTKQ